MECITGIILITHCVDFGYFMERGQRQAFHFDSTYRESLNGPNPLTHHPTPGNLSEEIIQKERKLYLSRICKLKVEIINLSNNLRRLNKL